MFPGSSGETDKPKELVFITVLPSQVDAVDDKGNQYEILNCKDCKIFSSREYFKFEAGSKHLAEVAYTFSKPYKSGEYMAVGGLNIIRISWFGSRITL